MAGATGLSAQLQSLRLDTPALSEESARRYKLVHLTHSSAAIRRLYSTPEASASHPLLPEPAVWTQLCKPAEPCCPGFGPNKFPIRWGHLNRVSAEWRLWHLGSVNGNVAGHRFHKFALAPAAADYSSRGWRCCFVGRPSLSAQSPSQATIFPELVRAVFDCCPATAEERDHWHVGVLVDYIDVTPTTVRRPLEAAGSLTAANVRRHDDATVANERRQFNCPLHGPFWRKVEVRKPVAACFQCNVEAALGGIASWAELQCGDSTPAGGGEFKLQAVAREEERGRGRFQCQRCDSSWTSNRACRGFGQFCHAQGCDARQQGLPSYPYDIRLHTVNEQPYHFRRRRPAAVREEQPEVHEEGHSGFGVERESFALGGRGERIGSYSVGRGARSGGGSGVGSSSGSDLGDGRPLGSVASTEDQPHATQGGGRGSSVSSFEVIPRPRRQHWCTGCASGACRRPPPPSQRYDSSGSTVTIAAKTWTTNGSEAWSDGSDPMS